MTVGWILRRARRQSAPQRRVLWAAAGSFLVLGLVAGATVLGLRATRGWMSTVGQGVHVIAFLRDEMEPDQVAQLTDLLRRRPGVDRVRLVEPAEALARLRDAARSSPAAGSWLNDLEPGYFPRSIEVALIASVDLPQRAAELSRRLRGLAGVAEVDAMADGVARLGAWVRFGQRLGWAVVLAAGFAALSFLVSTVLRGREARRRQAQVLVILGETAGCIRLPANIALASAGLMGALAALVVLRLAWPALLIAVEGALGIASTPAGISLGLWESTVGLLAAPLLGWVLGYISTPVPSWVDA
ncbi:MAG: permease-like cell division protein FtsX [Polyangia bacterium]